ncbi:MAG: glycosyltransferase, partial [Candidatus Limnocylindrales bacterium]
MAGERLETVHLPNGVPTQEAEPLRESPVVLYLARLAPRKRPQYFVEAAVRLGHRHPRATFVMVGPDEGEGQSVRRAIAEASAAGVSISWAGAVAPEATGGRRKCGVPVARG